MFTRTPPKQQQGIATVLIVLLIAVSLTAAVLAGIQYNRSAQEQAISLHAQTAAQSKAWETAEALRIYFEELSDISSLSGQTNLPINIISDSDLKATLVAAYKESDSPLQIEVKITAEAHKDTKAHAISTLNVVYELTPDPASPSGSDQCPSSSGVDLAGDTDISGGIKIYVDQGRTYDISVDGNVTIGGVSINGSDGLGGINSIRSTNSINFTGGTSTFFEKLHANCDIKLASGASGADIIYARNNICLENTATPPAGRYNAEVKANGSVYIKGGQWGHVMALAGKSEQRCPATATKYCSPPSAPGVSLAPKPTTRNITTYGTIQSESSTNSLGVLKADGNLFTAHGMNFQAAHIGGTCSGPVCDDISPPSHFSLTPVPLVEIKPDTIDISKLEPYANYIFEHDGTNILVKVKNVASILDGTYSLTHKTINYNVVANFICLEGNPDICHGPIAEGTWTGDTNAISYNEYRKEWTIKGQLAPGFVIFKGNLVLDTGTFTNSFAATGNAKTTGDLKVYALNYSGYNGKRGDRTFAPHGVCNYSKFPVLYPTNLSGLYPTNLCDTSSQTFNYAAIAGYGNNGLITGGDISLGAGNKIFGAVQAGGAFSGSGSTTVHGFISGLGITQHTFGGGFTINLKDLPEGYDPGGGKSTSCPDSSDDQPYIATIRWSRYK